MSLTNPRVASEIARGSSGMPIRAHQNSRYNNFRVPTSDTALSDTHASDGSRRSGHGDAGDMMSNGVSSQPQYSVEEMLDLRPPEIPMHPMLVNSTHESVNRIIAPAARQPECIMSYSEEENKSITEGAFIRMDIGYKTNSERFKFIDNSENERRSGSRYNSNRDHQGRQSSSSAPWRSGRADSLRRQNSHEDVPVQSSDVVEYTNSHVENTNPSSEQIVDVNERPPLDDEITDENQSSRLWWYYDNSDVKQGPFGESTMRAWWDKGYLPPKLQVCDEENGQYETLENGFYRGLCLFLPQFPTRWTHDQSPIETEEMVKQSEHVYEPFTELPSNRRSSPLQQPPPPQQPQLEVSSQPREEHVEEIHHKQWKSPSTPSDDPDSDDHHHPLSEHVNESNQMNPYDAYGSSFKQGHEYEDVARDSSNLAHRPEESHSQYSHHTMSSGTVGVDGKVFHSQIHDRQLPSSPPSGNGAYNEHGQISPFSKNTAIGFLSEEHQANYDDIWPGGVVVGSPFADSRDENYPPPPPPPRRYYSEPIPDTEPSYYQGEYPPPPTTTFNYYEDTRPSSNYVYGYFDERRSRDEVTPYDVYPSQDTMQHVSSHEVTYNDRPGNGAYHTQSSPTHPTKPPFHHQFQPNVWMNETNETNDEHYVIDSTTNTPLGQSVPTVPDDDRENPLEQRLDEDEDAFRLHQHQTQPVPPQVAPVIQHEKIVEQVLAVPQPQVSKKRRRKRGSKKKGNESLTNSIDNGVSISTSLSGSTSVSYSRQPPPQPVPPPLPTKPSNRPTSVWGTNSRPSAPQPRQESVWNMSVQRDQGRSHLTGAPAPRHLGARAGPMMGRGAQPRRQTAASRLRQIHNHAPPPNGLHKSSSAPQPRNSKSKKDQSQRQSSKQVNRQNTNIKRKKNREKKSKVPVKPARMSQEFQAWCRSELVKVKPQMDADLVICLIGGEQNDHELRDVLMDAMGHSAPVSRFIDAVIMNRDGDQQSHKSVSGKKKKQRKR